MDTFQELALPESLRHTLAHMNFNTPTPIQAQAIPLVLQGQDILGTAQTGTGKTGAFGIPLVAGVLTNPGRHALVLTPTRELATQVMTQLQAMLGRSSAIKTALLIGGDSMAKQFQQLSKQPRVVVGTPGRIQDHLQRNPNLLAQTDFLVLDETDRMLDMGFAGQIDTILKRLAPQRQTLLFSATLPPNIEKLAQKYQTNPVRVAVAAPSEPATNIEQITLHLSDAEKYPALLAALAERDGSVVVFVKTKYGADRLATKLEKDGLSAHAIHGDLRQNKRERVLAAYRKETFRILVATDVAARGLDIPHIRHVINYDLPQVAEDYIHRIGRTARAGAQGEALNFVTGTERAKWQAIERLLYPAQHASARPVARESGRESSRKSVNKSAQKPTGKFSGKFAGKFAEQGTGQSVNRPAAGQNARNRKDAFAPAKPRTNGPKGANSGDAKSGQKAEFKRGAQRGDAPSPRPGSPSNRAPRRRSA